MVGRDPASEVDEELHDHLEQRIRDYIARGMDPEAAKHAALERLGDLERARNQCTELLAAERRAKARRIMISVSWLDVKLGLRMLAKYPGLSLVAALGMSLAIAIGAASFAVIYAILDPTLPLDEGDRVVAIQNSRLDDPATSDRQVLHDFLIWRDELKSVRDMGAFRHGSRNLISPGGGTELVRVAEMSVSGFQVARVPPLLGRPLVDDDGRGGASTVIVIAYEEWQSRFDGDPDIIGRQVRLGSTTHTVIGVMPEGFRFPLFHKYWIPLRLNPSDYERAGGPFIEVFGRLADGVTRDQARAELTTVARRIAAAYPETHEHVRTRILPFTHPYFDLDDPRMQWMLQGYQLLVSMLLADGGGRSLRTRIRFSFRGAQRGIGWRAAPDRSRRKQGPGVIRDSWAARVPRFTLCSSIVSTSISSMCSTCRYWPVEDSTTRTRVRVRRSLSSIARSPSAYWAAKTSWVVASAPPSKRCRCHRYRSPVARDRRYRAGLCETSSLRGCSFSSLPAGGAGSDTIGPPCHQDS